MKCLKFILILFLLLTVACNNDTTPDETPDPPVLKLDQKITVAGQDRNYHLFVPASPASADIVFLFHGFSGSANQILGVDDWTAPYKVWLDIAERDNLLLVVPDGNEASSGNQGWNDCRSDIPAEHPDSDDVAFFTTLLTTIQNQYERTEASVFVMGTSNGGFMTQRLAEEVPDQIDAIAIVVASRPVNSACTDSTAPLSVLIMNGTADPLTPYAGGQIASDRGEILSTPDTVDYWVERNQTNSVPAIDDLPDVEPSDNSTIRRYTYSGGTNQSRVELFEVNNGGHTEPSLAEHYGAVYKLVVGNQNRDLEMAEEVWRFFKRE